MALRNHVAVVIADVAFTEVVEGVVIASQVYGCGVHQVLEGIRLIGHDPLILGLRGVARDADIDVGALVCSLACELREHAVVANVYSELGALRAVANRHAQIARVPRLDGSPWLQLAVVQGDFAVGVDDDGGIKRRLSFLMVWLHDGKDAPDIVVLAGLLELVHLWVIEADEEFIIGPNLGVETGG